MGFPTFNLAGGGSQEMSIGETSTPHEFSPGDPAANIDPIRQTVWGYGLDATAITYPGPMLIAKRGVPVSITFSNRLPPATFSAADLAPGALYPAGMRAGDYPFVQPMTDLAAGGMGAAAMGRYSAGHAVVHLHGADLPWEFDGHPQRLPQGPTNPRGLDTVIKPGKRLTFEYPNAQRGGGLLWYHDHVMDSTARNVYAGMAGAYVLRAAREDLPLDPSVPSSRLPGGAFEFPLILQDRSFTQQGELLYGDALFLGEYLKTRGDAAASHPNDPRAVRAALRDWLKSDDPNAVPMTEFKGHALLVNGKIWPKLIVEPRPYRFRVLNGTNARYFVLRISPEKNPGTGNLWECVGDTASAQAATSIYQIGSDGGLSRRCVEFTGDGADASTTTHLVIAPGERADILVDFSHLKGRNVYLTNHSQESAPLGISGDDLNRFGDASLLENVLRFEVGSVLSPADYPVAIHAGARFACGTRKIRIADVLDGIMDEEDAAFGMNLPRIPHAPAAGNPQAERASDVVRAALDAGSIRTFVVKEFGDVAQNREDANDFNVRQGVWPPGRRGWSAITFRSDPASPQWPGSLWGGAMLGKVNSNPGPLGVAQWSPPLMGGPYLDGGRDGHHGASHWEVWDIYNLSGDIHPIHLHLVNFLVYERRQLVNPGGGAPEDIPDLTAPGVLGQNIPIGANEAQVWKDTVRANPQQRTRLIVAFRGHGGSVDQQSNFVWHCHILEHEDMGMMRPLNVLQP